MRILAFSYEFPRADQSSGELRFCTLLRILAAEHEVYFCCSEGVERNGPHAAAVRALQNDGIRVIDNLATHALQRHRVDLVWFEFYYVARGLMATARVWQPQARIIVDSVDVHYRRLLAKAEVAGNATERERALQTQQIELATYRAADLVITVSDEERDLLQSAAIATPVAVIPNVHAMHPLTAHTWTDRLELIFIGAYKHPPNVDAMLYFCNEVLPLVRSRVPQLRLRIIGSAPTDEILALAGPDVEVVGFVPDTAPYLESSDISIAPLRYGAGVKGKVGEAMAFGLPVVTTSVGAQGFGICHGEHVLIGDDPRAFADAICVLWGDRQLYERMRRAAWQHTNERYSTSAVRRQVVTIVDQAAQIPPKRMSPARRAGIRAVHQLERYVLWRLRT